MHIYFIVSLFAFYAGYISASEQGKMFSWTVKPQVEGMGEIRTLKLEYPEGTTALDIKKMIYDKLAESNKDNTTIQDKMYNIDIKSEDMSLFDDFIMPDIDKNPQVKTKTQFSLKLSKTLFSKGYPENGIQFSFMNPPSLSIDKKPIIDNFSMKLVNNKKDLEVNVTHDNKKEPQIKTSNSFLVENFKKYKQNRDPDQSVHLDLFKLMLFTWAEKANKTVSFQGVLLNSSQQKPTALSKPFGAPKPTSWFSSGWQKIQSFFSTTKSRVITALTVLGIIGAGTAAYKNWLPGFPGVNFPSTSRTSQQIPAMPGLPQK